MDSQMPDPETKRLTYGEIACQLILMLMYNLTPTDQIRRIVENMIAEDRQIDVGFDLPDQTIVDRMMVDVKKTYDEIIADYIIFLDNKLQDKITKFLDISIHQIERRIASLKSVGFYFVISRILFGVEKTIIRNELTTQLDNFEMEIPDIDNILNEIIQDAYQYVHEYRQVHIDIIVKIIEELRREIF